MYLGPFKVRIATFAGISGRGLGDTEEIQAKMAWPNLAPQVWSGPGAATPSSLLDMQPLGPFFMNRNVHFNTSKGDSREIDVRGHWLAGIWGSLPNQRLSFLG